MSPIKTMTQHNSYVYNILENRHYLCLIFSQIRIDWTQIVWEPFLLQQNVPPHNLDFYQSISRKLDIGSFMAGSFSGLESIRFLCIGLFEGSCLSDSPHQLVNMHNRIGNTI